jgi:hypothetical protein
VSRLWTPSAPAIIGRRKLLTGAAALSALSLLPAEPAFASGSSYSSSPIVTASAYGTTSPTADIPVSVNLTGCDLVHVMVLGPARVGSFIIDNLGNNYLAHPTTFFDYNNNANSLQNTLWSCQGGTFTSGMTVTCKINGDPDPLTVLIAGWSGSKGGGTYVGQISTGSATSGTTVQPGSITPTNNGSLLIFGVTGSNNGATWTVDSGFSIALQLPPITGANYGGAMAYLIQGAISPVNPTFTETGASTTQNSGIAEYFAASYTPPGGSAPTGGGIVMMGTP